MANLSSWIQRLFLFSAFIASLTCFARPDYNLPLYIFAYMAYGLQYNQKPTIAWTLAFTLITDVIWVLYWLPFWSGSNFEKGYWENGIHNFVVALSCLNIIFKVIIIGLIYKQEHEVKKTFTLQGAQQGLRNIIATR